MATVVNGTTYDERTPAAVVQILESARIAGRRLRLHFGDTDTGRDWCEEWDVTGRIGRSGGPVKVPILLYSRRSMGGTHILDHCIVKVRTAAGGRVLYQHPAYHTGAVTLEWNGCNALPFTVHVDGVEHAAFNTEAQRAKWLHKMGLTVEA